MQNLNILLEVAVKCSAISVRSASDALSLFLPTTYSLFIIYYSLFIGNEFRTSLYIKKNTCKTFHLFTIQLFCKMLQINLINSINSALSRHGFFGATPM